MALTIYLTWTIATRARGGGEPARTGAEMGGVVVVNMLTLDGVIQGPLREGAGTATSTPPGIATHKSARG
jgi:hypothetical protein